jgi:hypothetical protein
MKASLSPLEKIHQRITLAINRLGRSPKSITLVGASKGQPFEKIISFAQMGLLDFGENYVQEWKQKKEKIQKTFQELEKQLHWHFIGHLQRNKVSKVAGKCHLIHSVDSLRLAEKISSEAKKLDVNQKILLEINLAEEKNKSGMSRNVLCKELPTLVKLPNLYIDGLMAIPPALEPPELVRPFFRQLKSLLDECNQSGFLAHPMTELSMGMSHDYEIAIEEGATMVRIGTALFGPRQ